MPLRLAAAEADLPCPGPNYQLYRWGCKRGQQDADADADADAGMDE
jgi:hypothetical protein